MRGTATGQHGIERHLMHADSYICCPFSTTLDVGMMQARREVKKGRKFKISKHMKDNSESATYAYGHARPYAYAADSDPLMQDHACQLKMASAS